MSVSHSTNDVFVIVWMNENGKGKVRAGEIDSNGAITLGDTPYEWADNHNWIVFFDVAFDLLIERLTGRWICQACQRPFHHLYAPPDQEKICNSCGGDLYQREDDKLEVVENRLKIYRESTEPVLEYYSQTNKLQNLDASRSIEVVRGELASLLKEKVS